MTALTAAYKTPQLPNRERVTEGVPVITTDHANIHEGAAFNISKKFTLAAAAIGYLEIIVPAGAYVHFKPTSVETDGPKILVQLIEAPTVTTGSNSIAPVNRRRLGTPATSLLTVKDNPTNVSGGTVLGQIYVGGGTGNGANAVSGGNAANDNEWVLAQSTTYLLKVINNGSGSADVNVNLFWYEEISG